MLVPFISQNQIFIITYKLCMAALAGLSSHCTCSLVYSTPATLATSLSIHHIDNFAKAVLSAWNILPQVTSSSETFIDSTNEIAVLPPTPNSVTIIVHCFLSTHQGQDYFCLFTTVSSSA